MGGRARTFPAHELSGQAAFLSQMEAEAGFGWDLVVVPGSERSRVPTPWDLALSIQQAQPAALEKWNYDRSIASRLESLPIDRAGD